MVMYMYISGLEYITILSSLVLVDPTKTEVCNHEIKIT